MKNFIDFIVDSTKDESLSKEFSSVVEIGDQGKVELFLKEKGYTIESAGCKKVLDNKDSLKASQLALYY